MLRCISISAIFAVLIVGLSACGESASDSVATSAPQIASKPTATPELKGEEPPAGEPKSDKGNKYILSISSDREVAPENVLQEILYFMGAGGGMCMHHEYPHFLDLPADWGNLALGQTISVILCGWDPNEVIDITIQLPDGESLTQEQAASEDGSLYFDYSTTLNDPPGLYTVDFAGKGGQIRYLVYLTPPQKAHLELDSETKSLFFTDFMPKDQVRLFVYHTDSAAGTQLVAWHEFQVDSQGEFIIQLDDVTEEELWNLGFVAVGKASGQIKYSFIGEVRGGGVLLGQVVARTSDNSEVNILKDHNADSKVVSQVPVGTWMEVVDQSVMADAEGELVRWWPVRLSDGTTGWVSDRDVIHINK